MNKGYIKAKERNIKIITLGDTCVGKTSIIKRIISKNFTDHQITTIGTEISVLQRPYKKKNINMKLAFYDTAGQERFQNALPKNYMRDSHIVLLVFCDLKSLEVLKRRWYDRYKETCDIKNSKFIVIGNKSDLFREEKDEIKKLGKSFAEEIDAFFITCSAKSEDNIDNVEEHIVTESKRLIDEMEKESEQKDKKGEKISNKKVEKKSGCC